MIRFFLQFIFLISPKASGDRFVITDFSSLFCHNSFVASVYENSCVIQKEPSLPKSKLLLKGEAIKVPPD